MLDQQLDPKEVGHPECLGFPRYRCKWLKRVPCSWLAIFLTQPPTAEVNIVTAVISNKPLPDQLSKLSKNISYLVNNNGITF